MRFINLKNKNVAEAMFRSEHSRLIPWLDDAAIFNGMVCSEACMKGPHRRFFQQGNTTLKMPTQRKIVQGLLLSIQRDIRARSRKHSSGTGLRLIRAMRSANATCFELGRVSRTRGADLCVSIHWLSFLRACRFHLPSGSATIKVLKTPRPGHSFSGGSAFLAF